MKRGTSMLMLLVLLVGGTRALLIDDPVVFERIRAMVEANRTVMSSHHSEKREAGMGMLRIGQLAEPYGPSSDFSQLQGYAWELWLARNPVLTIAGEKYGIEIYTYYDGSYPPESGETVVALTEWMITHDHVHIVSTGIQGNNFAMEQTADALGVPCINSGDYDASFAPPQNWSLYLLPKLQTVPFPCTEALIDAGAKTFVVINDPAGFLQGLYLPVIQQYGGKILQIFNTTPAQFDATPVNDPSVWAGLVQQIKALEPFDVLAGATTEGATAVTSMEAFVQELHQNNVNPKAILNWSIGSDPIFRANMTWQASGHLIAEAYQPDLDSPDPVWGSSLEYDAAFREMFGIASSNNDAALAGAITMLVVGLNNSQVNLSSPAEILAALAGVNTDTIFGRLYFVDNVANRTMYCFQNNYPNASSIRTVWPKSSPSYNDQEPLIYPAYADFPPGWLSQYAIHKDWTKTEILAGTLGSFGLLIIITALVALVVYRKNHIIMIPKVDTQVDDLPTV